MNKIEANENEYEKKNSCYVKPDRNVYCIVIFADGTYDSAATDYK